MDNQPSLLRIESSKEHAQLKIPSFVKILKEVTEDAQYAAGHIAKTGWRMPENDKRDMLKELKNQQTGKAQ